MQCSELCFWNIDLAGKGVIKRRDWDVGIPVTELMQLPRRVTVQVWHWRGSMNGK